MRNFVLVLVFVCAFSAVSYAQESLIPYEELPEVGASTEPVHDPMAYVEPISPDDERFIVENYDEINALSFGRAMPLSDDVLNQNNIAIKEDLTSTIRENSDEEVGGRIDLGAGEETEGGDTRTWIDRIKDTGRKVVSSKGEGDGDGESLEGMVDKSKKGKPKGSNVSVFDISGVMLRMSLSQVEETLKNRGFRKLSQRMEIPNFIKWRNEEVCRTEGVIGYEKTMNCVIQKAKKENHQYVESAKFVKYETKEEIEVKFTSNFTDNKVYKVTYKSMAANIVGTSARITYLRNVKIHEFWRTINQKYGRPDNTQDVIWGMGDNKPYMQAATGHLMLEDPMFRELDYTRMSMEDQRYMNTNTFTF